MTLESPSHCLSLNSQFFSFEFSFSFSLYFAIDYFYNTHTHTHKFTFRAIKFNSTRTERSSTYQGLNFHANYRELLVHVRREKREENLTVSDRLTVKFALLLFVQVQGMRRARTRPLFSNINPNSLVQRTIA